MNRSLLVSVLLVATLAACPKPVKAPTAVAGGAQTVPAAAPVLLDGSGSTDPQNRPLAYEWSFVSLPAGSRAELLQPHAMTPSFTPDLPGSYAVQLVVTNGLLSSVPDTAFITATACGVGVPLVSKVKADQLSAATGATIQLSADVNDSDLGADCGLQQSLSYGWTITSRPTGSRATFNDATLERPTLVPDVPGEYAVQVVVTDSTGRSSPRDEKSALKLTATSCGAAIPVIENVGYAPVIVGIGTVIQMAATVGDPDNEMGCDATQALEYRWTLRSLPPGSHATLNSETVVSPSFTVDAEGDYVVRLVVRDSTGRESAPVDTGIHADACGNASPFVAHIAATPATPNPGQKVALNPTVNDGDNDPTSCHAGQTFTYDWQMVARPAGSNAVVSDPAGVAPTLTPDLPGTYQVSLTVRDSTGRTSNTAFVTVTTSTCGSAAPTVSSVKALPTAQNIGQTVGITASATDPDNDLLTCGLSQTLRYAWTVVSRPSGSSAVVADPASPATTFVPDVIGVYQLQVVATDSTGRSSAPAFLNVATTACGSAPPTAAPTASTTNPLIGTTVTLDAGASDADNRPGCALGQTLTYAWAFTAMPPGSRALLSNPGAAKPTFVPDVVGGYQLSLVATDSSGRSSAPQYVTVTTSNCGASAPTAVLSAQPAALSIKSPVTLNANITDPNVNCGLPQTFRYAWTLTSSPAGSSATLVSPDSVRPTFIPDVPGSYQVSLVVKDSSGNSSAPAFLTVTTSACGTGVPVASIAAATSTNTGSTVTLTGSATNPDNASTCSTALNTTHGFLFTLLSVPTGSAATLYGANNNVATFVPDQPGQYVVQLVATAQKTGNSSAPATLTITASQCGANSPMAADDSGKPAFSAVQPLPSGAVLVSSSVAPATLDTGLAVQVVPNIVDVDAVCGAARQTLTTTWRFLSLPTGSRASLNDPLVLAPSFTPDTPGDYVLELVSEDSTARSTTQTFRITVGACGARAPTAVVGMLAPSRIAGDPTKPLAATVNAGATVQLDASASFDSDAAAGCGLPQSLSYQWTFLSLPAGASVAFNRSDIVNPSFRPTVRGRYVVALIASDGAHAAGVPAVIDVQ